MVPDSVGAGESEKSPRARRIEVLRGQLDLLSHAFWPRCPFQEARGEFPGRGRREESTPQRAGPNSPWVRNTSPGKAGRPPSRLCCIFGSPTKLQQSLVSKTTMGTRPPAESGCPSSPMPLGSLEAAQLVETTSAGEIRRSNAARVDRGRASSTTRAPAPQVRRGWSSYRARFQGVYRG